MNIDLLYHMNHPVDVINSTTLFSILGIVLTAEHLSSPNLYAWLVQHQVSVICRVDMIRNENDIFFTNHDSF